MLELKNIRYDVDDNKGRVEILKDVSFTVESGKFVVITGPNGGGKSAIAKLIAGVNKSTGGQILFDGEDITEKSITNRARMGISYTAPAPEIQGNTCIRPSQDSGHQGHFLLLRPASTFQEVGMCARDYIDREVNDSLSGGELKRIEIATILARSTKLGI